MLGGALGDALGYPVEFESNADAIAARLPALRPRLISDDTQMTLFTVEAIVQARAAGVDQGWSASALGAYQRWYATQAMRPPDTAPPAARSESWLLREPRLHARRAPGNTCLSALARSFLVAERPTVESPPNHSKGCGAVMRSAPFGLAAATREQAFTEARDAGVLTHGHPSGYLSAALFAAVIHDVARGTPLRDAIHLGLECAAREPGHEEVRDVILLALATADAGPIGPAALEQLGGGWVGEEALAIGLACALRVPEGTPQHVALALSQSVTHAGDSDSTGSIAGNLLGAMFGREALPTEWLASLELVDVVERLSAELVAAITAEPSPR